MSEKPETDRDEEFILNDDTLETLRNTEDFINQSISFNDSLLNQSTYFSGILGKIESFDYTNFPEHALDVVLQPYNYVMHEVPLSQKLACILFVFFVFGILIPVVETGIRWVKAVCHPITFPYKHVLITGCAADGLGKALV